jgi:hypothetical protein
MACFCMSAELAYAEEFDVKTEDTGGGLGDAFNCLVLVIRNGRGKGEGGRGEVPMYLLCA